MTPTPQVVHAEARSWMEGNVAPPKSSVVTSLLRFGENL
jgi:hypothetical protein